MKKVMYRAELLGIEIMNLRKGKRLSQEDVAWKTGLSRSQVGRIERGEAIASEVTLRKIEDALELPVYYLDKIHGEYIQNESVESVLAGMKADIVGRDLSEKSIMIIAHVARAVADVLEEFDE